MELQTLKLKTNWTEPVFLIPADHTKYRGRAYALVLTDLIQMRSLLLIPTDRSRRRGRAYTGLDTHRMTPKIRADYLLKTDSLDLQSSYEATHDA